MLTKVLRVDLKEYKEMEKSEQREEMKGYLTKELRRAKAAVEEMEQELFLYS